MWQRDGTDGEKQKADNLWQDSAAGDSPLWGGGAAGARAVTQHLVSSCAQGNATLHMTENKWESTKG